jgi:Xaa-Pro aminopeptidase
MDTPPLHPRTVDGKTLLLIDSGGQYECGTTDITRTFHFGTPTEHQKRCYTRVLQGHIKLSQVGGCSRTFSLGLGLRI